MGGFFAPLSLNGGNKFLEVFSQLGGSAERLGEVQRRVGRDPALSLDQLVQPRACPAEFPCKFGLRDSVGFEKLFEKNFAWMKWVFLGRILYRAGL